MANLTYPVDNDNVVVLRIRKGVPGIGQFVAKTLGANQVTCGHTPSRRVREGAAVFNYGRSQWPVWAEDRHDLRWMNTPDAVANAVSKLRTLQLLEAHGVPSVAWTTDGDFVLSSLVDGNSASWYARTTVSGKKGNGIVLLDSPDDFVEAPLYTADFHASTEYRVHVFDGEVIDITQKKRMGSKKLAARGIASPDERIRNHARGWVFAHNNLHCDEYSYRHRLEEVAVSAVSALGLTYGGVDVLVGDTQHLAVCEVNSAPGMRKSKTKEAYINAINKFVEGL